MENNNNSFVKVCPKCGKTYGSEAVFCMKCGTKVVNAGRKCNNCGHELEEGAIFCMKCGTKVDAESNVNNGPQRESCNRYSTWHFRTHGKDPSGFCFYDGYLYDDYLGRLDYDDGDPYYPDGYIKVAKINTQNGDKEEIKLPKCFPAFFFVNKYGIFEFDYSGYGEKFVVALSDFDGKLKNVLKFDGYLTNDNIFQGFYVCDSKVYAISKKELVVYDFVKEKVLQKSDMTWPPGWSNEGLSVKKVSANEKAIYLLLYYRCGSEGLSWLKYDVDTEGRIDTSKGSFFMARKNDRYCDYSRDWVFAEKGVCWTEVCISDERVLCEYNLDTEIPTGRRIPGKVYEEISQWHRYILFFDGDSLVYDTDKTIYKYNVNDSKLLAFDYMKENYSHYHGVYIYDGKLYGDFSDDEDNCSYIMHNFENDTTKVIAQKN